MGKYKDLDDIAKEIAESLNTKDILVYAFNATGKTRLSVLLDKNDYEGLCPIGRTKTKSGRAETDKPN